MCVKTAFFLTGVVGLFIGGALGFVIGVDSCSKVIVKNPSIIEDQIKEIQVEQDSLKNEVSRVDTVIVTINREYEKDTATIINQSVSEDI